MTDASGQPTDPTTESPEVDPQEITDAPAPAPQAEAELDEIPVDGADETGAPS